MNVTPIPLSKIVPDKDQPRQYFDEAKLGRLSESIKTYGIKNPLILEVQNDDKFLIIDGERRYRVATNLGLKEVPAILHEPQNSVSRLIEQFHIQEMHEGWTAVEKAIAVSKLAEELNISMAEVSKILGIPRQTAQNYINFGKIIDRKNFEKMKVPIDFAQAISNLVARVRKVCSANDIEFDRTDVKKFENAVFLRINTQDIKNRNDLNKIKDSLTKQSSKIHEFMDDDTLSVDKLYIQTKARSASMLRQLYNQAGYLTLDIEIFMKDPSSKVPKETIERLKKAKTAIIEFLNKFE